MEQTSAGDDEPSMVLIPQTESYTVQNWSTNVP